MYQNEFNPVIYEVTLNTPFELSVEEWKKWTQVFIKTFSKEIESNSIIGHIKGILEISEECYIQFSYVSSITGLAMQVQGEGRSDQTKMILNVLVAGVSSEFISKKLQEGLFKAQDFTSPISGVVTHMKASSEHSHDHHDHHCH